MSELEMRTRLVNWLNIDEELLAEIVDHIDCHHTLCKFRSVCKKWRSNSPFSSHKLYSSLPRQILTFDYRFKSILGCENRLKFLVGSVVYLIQPLNQNPNNSPKFWVVSLEELNPGLLKIRYPLTKSPIGNFPENFPKSLNSANFRVSLIGKGLKFCFSNGDEDVFDSYRFAHGHELLRIWSSFPTNTKVALYLHNEYDFEYYFDHSFVVLLLDQGGILGVLRRGEWYYLGDVVKVHFDDIVNYKGKVCAIDRRGVAYLIDSCESRSMNVISGPICAGDASDRRKLLAEAHGKLYMIVREGYKFRVYNLNEGQHMWEEIYSLEDRILFVTFDGCYFVEASDIVGCRGNCIFFPKNCFPNYSDEYYPDDELFKGANKYLEIGVFYMDEDCAKLISSYPGLPDMFWPPPSWLWPNPRTFTWPFEEDDRVTKGPNQEGDQGKNSDNLIPSRDWSELPKELLKLIADHLTSYLDYSKFRAVCKKWHSSCHLSGPLLYSQLPHKVFTGCYLFENSDRSTFLVARIVYLLRPLNKTASESSKPWLISVEDLITGKFQLCHPLSKIPLKKLPMNFPKSLNFSEFQVSKLSYGFKFCFSNGDEDVFGDHGFSKPWSDYPAPNKVILLSENATSIYDCVAVILFLNQGGSLSSFILKTNQCGYIKATKKHYFDDIVKFKGYICAVDSEGIAYLIDINDGFNMRIVDTITERLGSSYSHENRRKLLVESFGELYMIVRGYWDFQVYKLNDRQGKWNKMDNLGDRILFISFDSCFFVDAKDIPGCRGNCIVFPKNCFPLHSGGYSPDYRLFDGERKHLTIGVFYLDEKRCKVLSSYPSLSELFWPPPSWLCPDSCLYPCEAEDEHMDSSSQTETSSEDEETATDETTWESDDELFPKTRTTVEIPESSSVVKFQGVDVRSDLVPYLKKIWKMHDFIEGHAVRSNSLLTWAFESLAKMMIIIQNNRGKKKSSLDESQAEYLNSTLVDLQSMNFSIGWMVPLVEKTLARYKSKDPEDTVMELKVERSRLLGKLVQVESKLVEQNRLVDQSRCSVRH